MTALTIALSAPAALAQDNPIEARLIESLTSQGYVILEQGYTWLGRLRIVAENGELHRELVINPGTGEILRDYAVLIADINPPAAVASTQSGHGSGGAGTASTGAAVASSADPARTAADAGIGAEASVSVIAPATEDAPAALLMGPALEN